MRDYEEGSNPDLGYCPRGSYGWTDRISNSDDITFGDDIGGVSNPMLFYGTVWPVRKVSSVYNCIELCNYISLLKNSVDSTRVVY